MNPGTLAHKILGFVFPDICLACGRRLVDGEKVICLHCQGSLPRINCIPHTDNAVHRHLASTIPIEKAAAMFVYRRGDIFTKPIHTAKYGGRPAVARELGRMFAARLDKQSFFNSIDAITPVPLHWWKHIKRGYNQSEHIARGIADITGIPVHTHLLRASGHGSQTQLSRTRRWENASATYLCKGNRTYSCCRRRNYHRGHNSCVLPRPAPGTSATAHISAVTSHDRKHITRLSPSIRKAARQSM